MSDVEDATTKEPQSQDPRVADALSKAAAALDLIAKLSPGNETAPLKKLQDDSTQLAMSIRAQLDSAKAQVDAAVAVTEGDTKERTPAEPAPPWALPLGMGAFGALLGTVTGISVMQGVTQILLTGVSTFVGGVLLTYAGFRRPGQKADAPVDAQQVGFALALFSIGALAGTLWGVAMRYDHAKKDANEARLREEADARQARLDAQEDRREARAAIRNEAEWRMSLPATTLARLQLPALPAEATIVAKPVEPGKGEPAKPTADSIKAAAAFVLQNDDGPTICRDVATRVGSGGYDQGLDISFAQTDAIALYRAKCKNAKSPICSDVKVEGTRYDGANARLDAAKLFRAFCNGAK